MHVAVMASWAAYAPPPLASEFPPSSVPFIWKRMDSLQAPSLGQISWTRFVHLLGLLGGLKRQNVFLIALGAGSSRRRREQVWF